jgi:hypothetical protein
MDRRDLVKMIGVTPLAASAIPFSAAFAQTNPDGTTKPGSGPAGINSEAPKKAGKSDAQGHTLNAWGQTDADYALFNVSREIKPEADGWRTKDLTNDPNVYEWWYFDIHNHDGTIVNGSLTPQGTIGFTRRSGPPVSRCTIGFNRNNVQRDKTDILPYDQFDAATDRTDVRAGGLRMWGDFETLHVKGTVADREIDVTFKQAAIPFRAGNGYMLLGSAEKFQGWFNPFPSSHATGWVKIDGETINIDGDGYHDHNYGNVPVAEGFRGWFWARPSFGRYATLAIENQIGERFGGGSAPVFWVYDKEARKELVRAITFDDLTITFGKMVSLPDPLTGGAYPSLTVYNYHHDDDSACMQLNDTGVLTAFFLHNIADAETQKYLTSVGSNGPYYIRRSADVDLTLDLRSLKVKDKASGFALHELEESNWPQYVAYR